MASSYAHSRPLILDSLNGLCLQIGAPTLPIWDTAGRPSSSRAGTIGFNSQTSTLEVWTGSVWKSVLMT